MSGLYDTDIVLWSEQQAGRLRQHAAGANDPTVDWPNIIEEIEALGRSERTELVRRIGTVIEHLAKLEASPAINPRIGWMETVLRTREQIDRLVKANPSLRPSLAAVVAAEHEPALRLVRDVFALQGETPQVPPEQLRYDVDQVLGSWFPDRG
jgi:hypothetical protein